MPGPSVEASGSTRRRLRLALAALLGLAAAIGAGLWARDAVLVERAAREARLALAWRRFAEAEGPLARWLASRPGSAEAHYLKARVALALDRPREVAEELGRAEALGYDRAAVERTRAVVLARAGKVAEAEEMLRRWPTGGPAPEVDEALARVYLATFRFGLAGEAIDRWRRAAPDDPRPYLWRAEIDSRRQDGLPDLIRDYRDALSRNPSLARARLGLADALREAKRFDEAAVEYRAYLKLRPDDPAGHLGDGLTALGRGDEAAAISRLDRALGLDPKNVPALTERAAIEQRRGRNARALALLDRAAEGDPHDPEIHHRRSRVLRALGRREQADAEAEAANRLRKELDAMAEIRKGLLARPDDRGLQAEAARWLIEHGHDEEGLRWAQKVLREEPGHAETNRLLADYYARRGDAGLANYYRLQGGAPAEGGRAP